MNDEKIISYLHDVQKDVRELRKEILNALEESKKAKLEEV